MRHAHILAAALLAALFAVGCQSYDVVQRNVFSDEDGNLVAVDYGRSGKDHVNTFVAPMTGKKMEFKSKLVVRVELPDGDTFTAWQCMNFLRRGTMYRTDNEKWMLLANGFSCVVYLREDGDSGDYREVYRGVLCDTPDIGKGKKDSRWKTVPQGGRSTRERKGKPQVQQK